MAYINTEEQLVRAYVRGVYRSIQTIMNSREQKLFKRSGGGGNGAGLRESIYNYDRNAIRDRDENEWIRANDLEDDRRALNDLTLEDAVKLSRNMYLTNCHARGIVRSYVKWVIGKGVKFTPVGMSKAAIKSATNFWREWGSPLNNNWGKIEKEIVKRCIRDGEAFLQFYPDDKTLPVRLKNPLRIKDARSDTSKRVSFGIQTEEDDVETPVLYYFVNEQGNHSHTVPAEEMVHIKVNVDSDVKRGLPVLFTCMTRLRRFDTWLEDRIILNKIRTAIALIRQHKGGPTAVQQFANAAKTGDKYARNTSNTNTEEQVRVQKIRGGTIIDANQGVEYKYLEPKLDARDVQVDGRHILMSAGASIGLSEFIVSTDTSGANYASTQVAEYFSSKEFEDCQTDLDPEFRIIWWTVMKWGMGKGYVHKGVAKGDVELTFPRVISRKFKEEALARQILFNARVISPQTWAAESGLDYDRESKLIEEFLQNAEAMPMPGEGQPGEEGNKETVEDLLPEELEKFREILLGEGIL